MATCTKCNQSIPDGSKFCNLCGAKQVLCPKCGASLPENSLFCNLCGAKVEGDAPQAAPISKKWDFCKIDVFTSNTVVGSDKYRFKVKNTYGKKKLYQVYHDDLTNHEDLSEILDVPCGSYPDDEYCKIAWAYDKLWIQLCSDYEFGCNQLYIMNPETLQYTLALEFGTGFYSPYSDIYLTSSAFYNVAAHRSGYENDIIRIDRETKKAEVIYTGDCRDIISAGLDTLFILEYTITENRESYLLPLVIDVDGHRDVFFEHPDFKPMMPVIAALTKDFLPEGKMALSEFCQKHIAYVDFTEALVYIKKDDNDTNGYVLPFGATQKELAKPFILPQK